MSKSKHGDQTNCPYPLPKTFKYWRNRKNHDQKKSEIHKKNRIQYFIREQGIKENQPNLLY